MDEYEYMWLPRFISPQYFIDEKYIEHLFIHNGILVKNQKFMYGLPQSGRLAYIGIIKQLRLHGYNQAGFTPGLFKHETLVTMFSLVADDFGVKYTAKNNTLRFIDTLKKTHIGITIDWSGRIFLGVNLDWDYTKHTANISMTNYVNKSLSIFQHTNLNMTNIHHIHTQHQTIDGNYRVITHFSPW